MTSEEIKILKEALIEKILNSALLGICDFTHLPCRNCPLYKYWKTHNWEGKNEKFHCKEMASNVLVRDNFKKWMAEQW